MHITGGRYTDVTTTKLSFIQQQRDYSLEAMGFDNDSENYDSGNNNSYRDEVYSRRVPAGKRTYFLDVKATRSGEDFFITITERKRLGNGKQEKFRVFLYKEDFGKFIRAMHDVMNHIKEECLPEHDFEKLPELTGIPDDEEKEDPVAAS